jgi:Domain of unknown function (DUF4160)
MPELSRFYGLVIYMNYREHDPAHFHARYQGFEVSIELESGRVTGEMPRRALQLIFEWMDLHRAELFDNWNRVKLLEPLTKIEPLP